MGRRSMNDQDKKNNQGKENNKDPGKKSATTGALYDLCYTFFYPGYWFLYLIVKYESQVCQLIFHRALLLNCLMVYSSGLK